MDLDLAQVRAFVAAARRLHFGQAAAQLHLTQQALSKRIARLEETLGVRLFERAGGGVELTAAGRRFLDPAAQALRAGDAAVAAAREERPRRLRMSVWGHMFAPLRTIRAVLADASDVDLEVSPHPGFAAARDGLRDGRIDVALGRVHALDEPWPTGLTSRLVRLEPVKAVMAADSPLASHSTLRPAGLHGGRLWFPASAHQVTFLSRFAEQFGVPGDFGGVNLGLDAFFDHLRDHPGAFSLLPADVDIPPHTGLRELPVADPVPLYAWHLVWRTDVGHPHLPRLLDAFARRARDDGWLSYDPARHWLPETDHDALGPAGSGPRAEK
ncbi:LysR family transcriptional regulator [Streptomyces sp. NPDC051133]|uniref:LysR family transcriptional regulator n=1 Tax=Streptomyces sp. NPDC051133 TaxID=3155521 RepID=UPI003447B172